jgi:hypothetical protein
MLESVLETVQPELSFDRVIELADAMGAAVLCLGGDLDSSNVRVKHFIGSQARQHNAEGSGGVILVIDTVCGTHILHRIVETAFCTQKLIASLHSTAYVCFCTNAAEVLLRVAKDIILEDLRGGGTRAGYLHFTPTPKQL